MRPREAYSGADYVEVVYESTLDDAPLFSSEVTHDLDAFRERCDLYIANRWSEEFADVAGKIYARDPFRSGLSLGTTLETQDYISHTR